MVARTSPTPVTAAAGPAATPVSAACTPRSGIVEITSTDGTVTGYLADVTTRFGQYGFSPNKTDAIQVQAHCDGKRFDLTTLVRAATNVCMRILLTFFQDTNAPYPYLGGVTGLSSVSTDLLPGSSNYAYFGGVTHSE